MRNNGGAAFPVSTEYGTKVDSSEGMSLRDYFAAKASDDDVSYWLRALGPQATREHAKYAYADAMIAERDK